MNTPDPAQARNSFYHAHSHGYDASSASKPVHVPELGHFRNSKENIVTVLISRRNALRASAIGGAAVVLSGVASTGTAAAAINPTVSGEDANVTDLRRALDDAAKGIDTGFGRDDEGRVIVKAAAVRYTIKDTLVIGGNTNFDASAGRFVADFSTTTYTYTRDPNTTNRHSAYPAYPTSIDSHTVSGALHATMLINYVPSDTIGGYSAPGNIRINGGSWDPTWNYLDGTTHDTEFDRATLAPPMNVITMEHTSDIQIKGVTIWNVKWWHAVELNAVHNAVVSDCQFNGWIEDPTVGLWHGEALQLDLAGPGNTWAGRADNTPCRDIRILRNHCAPSDSKPAWGRLTGSHTAMAESIHSDVWIECNTVNDSKWDAIGPMNTQNVCIRENTVQNCWGGIYVKSLKPNPLGTVDIMGNTITLTTGSNRPALGIATEDSTVPVSDAAVYGNMVSDGGFIYGSSVSFRRPPQTF